MQKENTPSIVVQVNCREKPNTIRRDYSNIWHIPKKTYFNGNTGFSQRQD